MDSIEPQEFLDYLRPLLTSTGSVKSNKEIPRFVQRMKVITALSHKCLCLQVLKATTLRVDSSDTLLTKFFSSGGWPVLNLWLSEAKRSNNVAMTTELLELMRRLPVTVDLLKSGTVGKLVKQLSKAESSSPLKDLAIGVLEEWMNLIKTSTKEEPTKLKGKRPGGKTPEEPIEKRAKPANLFKLGSKEGLPSSKSKIVQESTGFMTAVKSTVSQGKRQQIKKTPPKLTLQSQGKTVKAEGAQTPQTPEMDVKKVKEEEEERAENHSPATAEDETGDGKIVKKKKKSVSWAPDSKLRTIRFFESDETERANVHRQSFVDALQSERLREKQVLETAKLQSVEDLMEESFKWSIPKRLDGFIELIEHGMNSKEKVIQAEREQQNLAFFFLSKESLQESPFEPDSEQNAFPASEPKEIPLNESNEAAATTILNPPSALPSATTAPPPWASGHRSLESTAMAAQSLLGTMMAKKANPVQDRYQPNPPSKHGLFEQAFDPHVQSQISTENLKQILQSTTHLTSARSQPSMQNYAPINQGELSPPPQHRLRYPPADGWTQMEAGIVQYPVPQKDYQGPYRNQHADYRQRPYDYSRSVPMTNNTRQYRSGDEPWRR
eukprot:m.18716 g.18716  ORF g.18716 m.18716 type:complete len:609 (+) comp27719_c0_seq2:311-2137(+)